MQIFSLLYVEYAATVVYVGYERQQEGKPIFKHVPADENGPLMATALHLFLTQLKPQVKLLKKPWTFE